MTSEQYQETSEVFYSASVPVQIFCLGLVIPLTEELMFRGVLFNRQGARQLYEGRGLFLSFIRAHPWEYSAVFVQLYFGTAAFYVYEKYGSFKAPAVLHVVANITSLIVTEIGGFDIWLAAKVSRMGIAAVVCAFAGSIMFVLIQKIDEKPDVTPPPAENTITPDMFR